MVKIKNTTMKKILTVLFASALIYSCGDSGNNNATGDTNKADTSTPATPPPPAGGDVTTASDRGLELIGSSDCMACHALDRKVIGPAYKEVANKYENNQTTIDTLVSKIKKGGMGVWGNVPMTPHPDLPDADAQEMVKYILSLKNK
jgi:cytochrome c